MVPNCVAALLLTFVSLSPQPSLPRTPAGRVLATWLAALNSGDVAALQAFDATHRTDTPVSRLSEAETISALTAKLNEQVNDGQFSGAILIGRRGRIVFEKAVG